MCWWYKIYYDHGINSEVNERAIVKNKVREAKGIIEFINHVIRNGSLFPVNDIDKMQRIREWFFPSSSHTYQTRNMLHRKCPC